MKLLRALILPLVVSLVSFFIGRYVQRFNDDIAENEHVAACSQALEDSKTVLNRALMDKETLSNILVDVLDRQKASRFSRVRNPLPHVDHASSGDVKP